MESQNYVGFEHLGDTQIRALAHRSKKTERYVRYILSGERKHDSIKARAIWEAATTLNNLIEAGLNKSTRKLAVICEND